MNCDGCDVELKPVFPYGDRMRRRGDYPQYKDALIIDLHGGYGMLIDPIYASSVPNESNSTRFILCKECGINFLQGNEFMNTPETEHVYEGMVHG